MCVNKTEGEKEVDRFTSTSLSVSIQGLERMSCAVESSLGLGAPAAGTPPAGTLTAPPVGAAERGGGLLSPRTGNVCKDKTGDSQ